MFENATPEQDCFRYSAEEADPFPDDPNYSEYLQARAKTERLAIRVFRRSIEQVGPPALGCAPNRGPRCFNRRLGQRLRRRTPRVPRAARHVVRRCSSGVGNESSGSGDSPEPPPASWQLLPDCGDKNSRELSSRLPQFDPVISSLRVMP